MKHSRARHKEFIKPIINVLMALGQTILWIWTQKHFFR